MDIEESIKKSDLEPDSKSWYVKGYATTPDLDLQDDIINPNGLDISHLIKHGYINYEHQPGDEYKIGVPTDKTKVDSVGLYVEAKLYKNNPHAKTIWGLAKSIADSGINRKLGFSIEGYAQERNADDPRIIEKAYITNIALTTSPANPNATWDAFMKAYTTGHGITPETQVDGGALRTESFARSLYNLSFAYSNLDKPTEYKQQWEDIGNYLETMERQTPEAMVVFLQLYKGLSRDDAVQHIDKYINNTMKDSKSIKIK